MLETPKRVLWQTVKTQMKCSITLHFIRVCTVRLDENIVQGLKYVIIKKFLPVTSKSTQHFLNKYVRIQKVKFIVSDLNSKKFYYILKIPFYALLNGTAQNN